MFYTPERTQISECQNDHKKIQIQEILRIASVMYNVTFDQVWIRALLNLFQSKQQIGNFCEYFIEASKLYIDNPCQKDQVQITNGDPSEDCGIDIDSLDMLDILSQDETENDLERNELKGQNKLQPGRTYFEWLKIIEQVIMLNPYMNLQDIRSKINQVTFEYEDAPSIQTIQNMLKDLNYRQKSLGRVSIERNSLVNLQNRYKYCFEYNRLTKAKAKILFLDICKFDMNLAPELIWTKNNKPIQKNEDNYIEILACLGKNQLLSWKSYKKFKRDNINQSEYIEFFLSEISEKYKDNNIAAIVNSCNLVISRQIKKIFIKNNWRLFILPPLSPQLNPVELFFKEIKAQIRKSTTITNLDELQESLNHICHRVSNIQHYFESLNGYIMKGLTKSLL